MAFLTSFGQKLHFTGDGQYTHFEVFDTQKLTPTHHKSIGITALNATNG